MRVLGVVLIVCLGLLFAGTCWKWILWWRWRRVRDVTPTWLNETAYSRDGDDRHAK